MHALMNAHCEQTFVRTNMTADRQMDGQMDGHSNICPHARVHVNTWMYALMNARMYDQTFGHTHMQTIGLMDGRTHTHALTHMRMHKHKH